jgi:hypothetical protein
MSDESCHDEEDDECDCKWCREQASDQHVCWYVLTDRGDECEDCGKLANQSADLGDERDIDLDGAAR